MIDLRLGDCLEVMKSIPDKSIDAIICDLPYGTTDCKWDSVIPFEPLWEQYKRIIKDNGAIVLFGSEPFSSYLRLSNIKEYKYDWKWEKSKATLFTLCKKRPLKSDEDIIVFYKQQSTYNPQMVKGVPYKGRNNISQHKQLKGEWNIRQGNRSDNYGLRYPRTSLKIANENKKGQHPTQKPLPLMEYLVKTYTNQGDTVLDNCMGSGTTGVACKNLGRGFIGIEQDATYFEIAKNRINEGSS
jgi:site-specific DNA-methyltransferase (adenine-specific)